MVAPTYADPTTEAFDFGEGLYLLDAIDEAAEAEVRDGSRLAVAVIHAYDVPQRAGNGRGVVAPAYLGSYRDDSPEMHNFMTMVCLCAGAVLAEVCVNSWLSMLHAYRAPQPTVYLGSYQDDSPEMLSFALLVCNVVGGVLAEVRDNP